MKNPYFFKDGFVYIELPPSTPLPLDPIYAVLYVDDFEEAYAIPNTWIDGGDTTIVNGKHEMFCICLTTSKARSTIDAAINNPHPHPHPHPEQAASEIAHKRALSKRPFTKAELAIFAEAPDIAEKELEYSIRRSLYNKPSDSGFFQGMSVSAFLTTYCDTTNSDALTSIDDLYTLYDSTRSTRPEVKCNRNSFTEVMLRKHKYFDQGFRGVAIKTNISTFLSNYCQWEGTSTAKALYEAYASSTPAPVNQTAFGLALKKAGAEKHRSGSVSYTNLSLKELQND